MVEKERDEQGNSPGRGDVNGFRQVKRRQEQAADRPADAAGNNHYSQHKRYLHFHAFTGFFGICSSIIVPKRRKVHRPVQFKANDRFCLETLKDRMYDEGWTESTARGGPAQVVTKGARSRRGNSPFI